MVSHQREIVINGHCWVYCDGTTAARTATVAEVEQAGGDPRVVFGRNATNNFHDYEKPTPQKMSRGTPQRLLNRHERRKLRKH